MHRYYLGEGGRASGKLRTDRAGGKLGDDKSSGNLGVGEMRGKVHGEGEAERVKLCKDAEDGNTEKGLDWEDIGLYEITRWRVLTLRGLTTIMNMNGELTFVYRQPLQN